MYTYIYHQFSDNFRSFQAITACAEAPHGWQLALVPRKHVHETDETDEVRERHGLVFDVLSWVWYSQCEAIFEETHEP